MAGVGSRELILNIIKISSQLVDSSDEDEEDDGLPFNRIRDLLFDDNDGGEGADVQHLAGALPALGRRDLARVQNFVLVTVPAYTDEQFVTHFRLQRQLVHQLAERYGGTPEFQSLCGHGGFEAISPQTHLLAFLWFAGHQTASFRDVADRFNLSLAGMHAIITRMINFILTAQHSVIKMPTLTEKQRTKEHYRTVKGLPGVIGSIDGSHIRIDRPKVDPDAYINRKRYFSIHLQGVVNENRKFLDVVVGWPGSVHDARVFDNSPTKALIETACDNGEYVFGDAAYPCLPSLITPYRDNGHLTRAQRQFNRTHSSCRISVEHSFGILKQRFRQLYFLRWRSNVRMIRFITACCVLHNLADEEDLRVLEPEEEDEHPDPLLLQGVNVGQEIVFNDDDPEDNVLGKDIRDELCRQLAAHNARNQ